MAEQFASVYSSGAGLRESASRLATGWKANHDNGDSSRVEQPARHGAVELGWSQVVLIVRDIMDSVDEGRTLAAIPGGISRDLGGPVAVRKGAFSENMRMEKKDRPPP